MPIDFKNKIKFIHIPRTGGSSIENALSLFNKENLWENGFRFNEDGCRYAPQHITHRMMDKYYPITKEWFSFTLVRNPYEKIVSEYFYIHRHFKGRAITHFNENNFYEWLKNDVTKFDIDHKLPQNKFIDKPVDVIIKLENIDIEWDKINNKLNTNYIIEHKNKSHKNDNTKYVLKQISKKTQNLIFEIYENDFIKLNYDYNI
jgi:hypothetical protein